MYGFTYIVCLPIYPYSADDNEHDSVGQQTIDGNHEAEESLEVDRAGTNKRRGRGDHRASDGHHSDNAAVHERTAAVHANTPVVEERTAVEEHTSGVEERTAAAESSAGVTTTATGVDNASRAAVNNCLQTPTSRRVEGQRQVTPLDYTLTNNHTTTASQVR